MKKTANPPLIVKILKTDIKNGKCGDSQNCPVAKAIRRQTKTNHVYVGLAYVEVENLRYYCTKKLGTFIDKFDNEEKVNPTIIRLYRNKLISY
jgi:hypothetical protein